MIEISNIKEFGIERPNNWTCLGGPEDFDNMSNESRDQIMFLNKEASDYLYEYFHLSNLHTGPLWEPFQKGNFKFTENANIFENKDFDLKKWLHNRGIPYSNWVFVLPNHSSGVLTMTWKMVIKNCDTLFFGDDIVIFDKTNQWCLSYWHEDEITFGKTSIINSEIGYKEFEELNEKEKKYPGFKHPYKKNKSS